MDGILLLATRMSFKPIISCTWRDNPQRHQEHQFLSPLCYNYTSARKLKSTTRPKHTNVAGARFSLFSEGGCAALQADALPFRRLRRLQWLCFCWIFVWQADFCNLLYFLFIVLLLGTARCWLTLTEHFLFLYFILLCMILYWMMMSDADFFTGSLLHFFLYYSLLCIDWWCLTLTDVAWLQHYWS